MKEWCNDTKSHWISLCISSCLIQIRVGNALNITRTYLQEALKSVHITACLSCELIPVTIAHIYFFIALWYGIKALCKWEDWLLLTLVDPYKQFPSKAVRSKGKKSCETTDGHLNFTYNLKASQREWNACGMNHYFLPVLETSQAPQERMKLFPNKGLFTAEIQMQTNLVFVAVHNSEKIPNVEHSKSEQLFEDLLWSCQCRKSFWEVY